MTLDQPTFFRDEVFPLSPADSIIVYATYAVPSQYHAAYYTHGNINWAIPPYNQPDFTIHSYQQQVPAPASLPPPSYDESQTQQQLHQQLQQQQQQPQAPHAPQAPQRQSSEIKYE